MAPKSQAPKKKPVLHAETDWKTKRAVVKIAEDEELSEAQVIRRAMAFYLRMKGKAP